jgi:hypothetical protein
VKNETGIFCGNIPFSAKKVNFQKKIENSLHIWMLILIW